MTRTPANTGETSALIRECLKGSAAAWDALIDRYKNLIYSVPIKRGIFAEDAADIFQAVCVDLLSELPRVRDPEALPAWLIQVAYRKCLRLKRDQARAMPMDSEESNPAEAQDPETLPDEVMHGLQREQKLRESIAALPPRCRQLVQMLFFENDPRPYREIAQSLGIATGSIGFIRGRCLDRLRKQLEKEGFR